MNWLFESMPLYILFSVVFVVSVCLFATRHEIAEWWHAARNPDKLMDAKYLEEDEDIRWSDD